MKRAVTIAVAAILVILIIIIVAVIASKGGGASTMDIVISEVLLKNSGEVVAPDGGTYDFIELHNAGNSRVNLTGWGLSDSLQKGVKYAIPAGVELEPDGYLVIWCSGDTSIGNMHTGFRLSAFDEVILYKPSGDVKDSIELRETIPGRSLALINDSWDELEPSPGFPNNEAGIAAYKAAAQNAPGQPNSVSKFKGVLAINEVMPSNRTVLDDGSGSFPDWVEIYNLSDAEVDLSGITLSDNPSKPQKYAFPEGAKIGAHDYVIVFCVSAGTEGEDGGYVPVPQESTIDPNSGKTVFHAAFGLAAYGESILISDRDGNLIDSMEYSRAGHDESFQRVPDGTGEFEKTDKPTPGYPNTQDGYEAFVTAYVPPEGIFISEIAGTGDCGIQLTPDNQKAFYPDYIELYNANNEPFDLSGCGLSLSPGNPGEFTFPEGTVIDAGQYLCVLALDSEKSMGITDPQLITGFNISSSGETVYLFNSNGSCIDKIKSPAFFPGMTLGRSSSGEVMLYTKATPNEANDTEAAFRGSTSVPVFSVNPGIYDAPMTVELSCEPGEVIYYTTDCTEPGRGSAQYSGPIEVNKNTVIRAVTYREGYFNGFSSKTGTYLLSADQVDHTLPVISLVTAPDNLWSSKTGIYAYGDQWSSEEDSWPYWKTAQFWQDWERPASFEVFNDDGQCVFEQNIGISISGSYGRGREQKGFAVMARDEYGKDRMNYAFFEDQDTDSYKSLVLRCGAQDQANGKIRDELSVAVLKDSDVRFLYQDYKTYVLYLNGKYWGVYFMREKRNRFFVAFHEDWDDPSDMILVKGRSRASYGSPKEWTTLLDYIETIDLTKEENYKYVADRIDLDSFMDYMICEIYVGNTDYWNIQMYRCGDNGKWRFIYYDFCWGWNSYEHSTLSARRENERPMSTLFNKLLKRSDWRDAFLRRFGYLMNTVFETQHVLKCIDELYEQVSPEIARERSLFNSEDSPYFNYVDPINYATYDRFERNIKKIRTYAEMRPAEMRKSIKTMFGLSNEYMKEVFGGAD